MGVPYTPKRQMASSSSASKSSSKKATPVKNKSLGDLPIKIDKNDQISVSEIENGYLVTQSGSTGKGRNQSWYSKQYFTPNNPIKFGKK